MAENHGTYSKTVGEESVTATAHSAEDAVRMLFDGWIPVPPPAAAPAPTTEEPQAGAAPASQTSAPQPDPAASSSKPTTK